MKTTDLLLKTAFCCMACDGEIAPEEIELVKKITSENLVSSNLDVVGKLNEFVKQINKQGKAFLSTFLTEIPGANLSEQDELTMVKIAIQTIEADEHVEYSEISFFKKIRLKLAVSDAAILAEMPDKEDYLLPDIIDFNEDMDVMFSFQDISWKSKDH